ncbi:hypothetical protein Lepto7376_2375 [[Leptolyngbya] sp. PCC 7376]|uniref:hypothetical protein n=1 Tax=[Leptolyngbya] sp. PCC 7376 TaxID=111781 RepID=UPI00029F28D2|nr:hypothetical protein [[Leptolyngbya] sp. PCC 7376]AFY38657.1 hypothetical protein Lepto7376_2375 [[Leptolyngbya] sp. PCC 7376]
MANRQFTEATNGNKYANLNTTFRVGSTAILLAYADLKNNAKPTTKVVDPYAPIEAAQSTKKPKINTRKIFLWIEEKLKNHGYDYVVTKVIEPSWFDADDINQLCEWFPDIADEINEVMTVDEQADKLAA